MLETSPRDGVLTTQHSPRGGYEILRHVGTGMSSEVYVARAGDAHAERGRVVALKRIDTTLVGSVILEYGMQELHWMDRLDHPAVLKGHETFQDGRYYCIITDYHAGGDMLTFINANGYLSERRARTYARQLASALAYVHGAGVVHRDIKLENLFLTPYRDRVVLGDWGLASTWAPGRKQQGAVGSPYYAAPEMHLDERYVGPEVDVWSLGIVLYAMTTGTMPFVNTCVSRPEERDRHLLEYREALLAARYSVPSDLTPSLTSLIQLLLSREPLKRPTAAQVSTHPWLCTAESSPR
jgi:MAP/microtubule affinity-regulating kinase